MKLLTLRRRYQNVNEGERAGFEDQEAAWLVANGYADPAPGMAKGEPDRQLVEPEVEVLNDTDARKAERDAYFAERKAPDGPPANKMVADAARKTRR
jgi:hypothetical protein